MSEKISREQALGEIESIACSRVEGTTTTICVLKTKSGVTFTGTSACVSLDDFDAEKGEELAKERAIGELWGALGTAKAFVLAACPVIGLAAPK